MMNKKYMIGVLMVAILSGVVMAVEMINPKWDNPNNIVTFSRIQNNSWIGQTFNLSYGGNLTKIEFMFKCFDSDNATSSVEIYKGTKEGGDLLGKSSKNVDCGDYAWIDYQFTNVTLTNDTNYYIYFENLLNDSYFNWSGAPWINHNKTIVPFKMKFYFPSPNMGELRYNLALDSTQISSNSNIALKVYVEVADTDGDGIPDVDDLCIDEPGYSIFNGCACSPVWVPVNTSCLPDDSIIQWYNDTNCSDFLLVRDTPAQPANITHENACDYCTSEMVNTSWTDWENISCLSDDIMNQTRSMTTYDVCGEVPNSTIYEYRAVEFCDYCVPLMVNSSWTEWVNQTGECFENNSVVQTRNGTQYDVNNCGEVDNETVFEYRSYPCDYCVPNWTLNETWDECLPSNIQFKYYYDNNSCNEGVPPTPLNQSCNYTYVDNSTDLEQNFTGIVNVEFKKGNHLVASFLFNFSKTVIDWDDLVVDTQGADANKGYIIVAGVNASAINGTKTMYLDNIDKKLAWVCIKDTDFNNGSIEEISHNCKGSDEYRVKCNGQEKYGYKCEKIDNGTRYKITGLKHSGVIQIGPPEEKKSSSGGGGGGSSSHTQTTTTNNTEEEYPSPVIIENESEPAQEYENEQVIETTPLPSEQPKVKKHINTGYIVLAITTFILAMSAIGIYYQHKKDREKRDHKPGRYQPKIKKVKNEKKIQTGTALQDKQEREKV